MKILIISLLIIALIVYVIYKVKKTFTKKELYSFIAVIGFIIAGMLYYNHLEENKMPDAFKAKYLKEKNLVISKLSYTYSTLEVVSSNSSKYNFAYIITKNDKEYVCEAKDVEVQKIEDEYVFKKYKEDCRLK